MHSDFELEALVKRAQKNDEAAFEQLVKKYQKLVYYIAVQRMGCEDDAMDIVQETFIEVKKSLPHLKEAKFFKAWLNKIVFSKISRFYGKRKADTIRSDQFHTLENMQEHRRYMIPEQSQDFQSQQELIQLCLNELNPIYRDVLILRYLEEFTLLEIAYALQIPEGTVKSRLNVAKKELRYIIEQKQEKEGFVLDFRTGGLEALLGTFFLSSFQQCKFFSSVSLSKVLIGKMRMVLGDQGLKASIGIALCAGTAITGVGLYEYLQPESESSLPIVEHIRKDENQPFPQISYRGVEIRNAKTAYSIIYQAMFHDKERDDAQLQVVYETLDAYGGEYAKMAEYLMTSSF